MATMRGALDWARGVFQPTRPRGYSPTNWQTLQDVSPAGSVGAPSGVLHAPPPPSHWTDWDRWGQPIAETGVSLAFPPIGTALDYRDFRNEENPLWVRGMAGAGMALDAWPVVGALASTPIALWRLMRNAEPGASALGRGQRGVIGYHGTGAKFRKFKYDATTSRTGEGAQVRGAGLYFGEAEGTGRSYQRSVGGVQPTYNGRPLEASWDTDSTSSRIIDGHREHDLAAMAVDKQTYARDEVAADWREKIEYLQSDWHEDVRKRFPEQYQEELAEAQRYLAIAEDPAVWDALDERVMGHMYKVDIDDKAYADFLDLDAGMGEQSEAVKEVQRQIARREPLSGAALATHGSEFYRELSIMLGGDEAASEALRQAGVKGSKFLDQKSRKAGEGTNNIVVFDDSVIRTLERDGVPQFKLSDWKRNRKTGQYTGAPPGIDTPEKVDEIVDGYVSNIEEAINAGIPPGYFYNRGHSAIGGVMEEPPVFTGASGITSPQTAVLQNQNEAIRAMTQRNLGAPINAGFMRGQMSERLGQWFRGEKSDFGVKVGGPGRRYIGALGDPNFQGLAPNDVWEIQTVWGYGQKKAVSSQPQVDFIDAIRQEAVDRFNAKHGTDLSLSQAQELNWATMKMRHENKTPQQILRGDTVQGALEARAFHPTYETVPGAAIELDPNMTAEQWHQTIAPLLRDETGRDVLYRAQGAPGQLPVEQGLGIFEGQVSPNEMPGVLVATDAPNVMAPESAALVNAVEMQRGMLLGQRAVAGNMPLRPTSSMRKGDLDAAVLGFEGGATPERLGALEARIGEIFPEGAPAITPAAGGRTALLAMPETQQFNRRLTRGALGDIGVDELHMRRQTEVPGSEGSSFYRELPWGEAGKSPVTNAVLEALDNPATPDLARRADSTEVRGVVNRLLQRYEEMEAKGLAKIDEPLKRAMRAWATEGIPGLRKLAERGLAPAFAIGIINAHTREQRDDAA